MRGMKQRPDWLGLSPPNLFGGVIVSILSTTAVGHCFVHCQRVSLSDNSRLFSNAFGCRYLRTGELETSQMLHPNISSLL
ncbi:Uncharacterized protein TCM_034900 [Theobroma cacao]|uniref:Uncharacterized protein n=1 Tax=Theobroma cacao TaxID=3641 RepID=A0A061FN93_THECC|nr:Uncharacterized protein TCM_034900 [Theobroma cacao]